MKLFEYQGREVFAKHAIPTPAGFVISRPEEFEALRPSLKFPLVIKAQVLVGGRGKAGGIRFAANFEEGLEAVKAVLGMSIKGLVVKKVFVVEKLAFEREFYAGVLVDRSTRSTLFMFSTEGGVEIESVPDDKIRKVTVNPVSGYSGFHTRTLLAGTGLPADVQKQLGAIFSKLYSAFKAMDAELLEINPLALTKDGRVVAADSKVILDDGALFRHQEFDQPDEELTPLEEEAREKGIAFIQLDGRIGVIANGAGLTMATLDALNEFGGKAGVFLDLGGTDNPEKVREAFLLMRKADPSVMLLNLFGGITKSDTVAKGVKMVLDTETIAFPIVTRIKGTNEKEAKEILQHAGLLSADTLQAAAKLTVDTERTRSHPRESARRPI
ncbi:MAG: ADP-forming succinate--CoA ligase subunit beta [Euryarchaeota archaeon]|nr:ADP-forming succinate--CoA ligase subunit beta [Euryarchaeota archaeon]